MGKKDLAAEVKRLSIEIQKNKEELAELRRKLPAQPVSDYTFQTPKGKVKLSKLFGDKPDLLVIHNMGKKCPYCTLWADGLNGIRQHLENRAAFVVSSPDDPETQKKFAKSRDWKFRMVSVKDSPFAKDMNFMGEKGGYLPGVSSFRKGSDGKIVRVAKTYFGPGDDFCALWHLFDLLADGVNGWEADFEYK
jgi:predicted dithiol-disulfide oxidoreductase (DUF899 family)